MSASLPEFLSLQFYAWEQLGRGHLVAESPVHLEPVFIPFFGHHPPTTPVKDDGLRPRIFGRTIEKLKLRTRPHPTASLDLGEIEETYEVRPFIFNDTDSIMELELHFAGDTEVPFERADQFLLMLSRCSSIVSFEIVGTGQSVIIQIACREGDAEFVADLVRAYLPDVVVVRKDNNLITKFSEELPIYVIDHALSDEFMRPLRVWNRFDPDPLAGIIGTLQSLRDGEVGIMQVLFQGVANPWAESMMRAVSDGQGGSFFADSPEMLPLAKEKTAFPLFGVVIRTAGQAESADRSFSIAKQLGERLVSLERPGSNSLTHLSNEGYDPQDHVDDLVLRESHRLGMLLNSAELTALVHVPDASVRSSKLRQFYTKTKPAPPSVINQEFKLGVNVHLGQEQEVSLNVESRLRHMHLIGATGTGKSSLLLKLIVQDIEMGQGVAVLDPHGDLVETVLSHIPDERLQDVVLIDPSDSESPVGLNLISAHGDAEKVVLSSDMTALFQRFATSWGDQMTSVLGNAINVIIEHPKGGTLIDLKRLLIEKKFRESFLSEVQDPSIQYYWKHEFPMLRSNAISPILTRLDTFLRPKIVRNMMAQKEGVNFHELLNSKRILLVKLAQGLIGEDNSYLLGSLVVAKIHQAAQARQSQAEKDRSPYFFYIDEFQHFVTPSMAAILSGSRKYGLGLVLAHQDLEQLARRDSELANSVISNPAIRVCFRCGDFDARKLESGFASFDATDLQSLGVGQAIARVGQRDHDFNFTFEPLSKVADETAKNRAYKAIESTRRKYAKTRAEVEKVLSESLPQVNYTPETTTITAPVVEVPKKHEEPSTSIEEQAREFIEAETEREELREHLYLQTLITSLAQARGFKATSEEPTGDGKGRVDVALKRNQERIAFEICVTNTVEYEVGNIEKCLKDGYSKIVMVGKSQTHLRNIKGAAEERFGKSLDTVSYMSPEEVAGYLDSLFPREKESETRTKGYRVKTTVTPSSDDMGSQSIKNVIARSFRQKK